MKITLDQGSEAKKSDWIHLVFPVRKKWRSRKHGCMASACLLVLTIWSLMMFPSCFTVFSF